jgi:hypothetical protein
MHGGSAWEVEKQGLGGAGGSRVAVATAARGGFFMPLYWFFKSLSCSFLYFFSFLYSLNLLSHADCNHGSST